MCKKNNLFFEEKRSNSFYGSIALFLLLLGCSAEKIWAQKVGKTIASQSEFNQMPNSDNQYKVPLITLLKWVEERYRVKIQYDVQQLQDKEVVYGQWRFRAEVKETLEQILLPFQLSFQESGPKKFKIKPYELHRKFREEGKMELDYLSSLYQTKDQWELRAWQLKNCLKKTLLLDALPSFPIQKPILGPLQKENGYEWRNISIEILPGLFQNGTVYYPSNFQKNVAAGKKFPFMLSADGHWADHRFRKDAQIRFATLAQLGVVNVSYDLFGWGESLLQVKDTDHRKALAQTIQLLGAIRLLDVFSSLKGIDTSRVGIAGGSGGASHSIQLTAVDHRIGLVAPIVMVSSYHSGGCPCENGMPIHWCGQGTNNPELAALAAPKPQLIVSDGGDWTEMFPEAELPFMKRIYGFYNQEPRLEHLHLPEEGHDFGPNKRNALYRFLVKQWKLQVMDSLKGFQHLEEKVRIVPKESLFSFGKKGEGLPTNALKGYDAVEKMFFEERRKVMLQQPQFRIAAVDLMMLKRQKPGAITLAAELGADGIEVDMGGLGNRITFDSQLNNDSFRNAFIALAKEQEIQFSSVAMSGYYAQSFCGRPEFENSVADALQTAAWLNVDVIFLPLGVQCDLTKDPSIRSALVTRLKKAGSMAQEMGKIIAIETPLSAKEQVALLQEIGSPAIKIYVNFSDILQAKRDISEELKILGADRIAMIHCTNKDGVWLENDPELNLYSIRKTLESLGWAGWLVVERSRDAKEPSNVRKNFGANIRYVQKVFQNK